jgi:hypothetical protein
MKRLGAKTPPERGEDPDPSLDPPDGLVEHQLLHITKSLPHRLWVGESDEAHQQAPDGRNQILVDGESIEEHALRPPQESYVQITRRRAQKP